MSKSKYNGIDPNSVLNEYGVDTTRLCLLFDTSPEESINWNPKSKCSLHQKCKILSV